MNDDIRTDAMRRHVAAIHISLSGPDFSRFLDPRRVLVGAGTPIPERERPQFASGLIDQRRHMIYFEFAPGANVALPTRINVVEPIGKRVAWFDDCVLWTGGRHEQIEIVPVTTGSNVRYVNRGGGLRCIQQRPADLEAGRLAAEARFRHTVRSLSPDDLSGQNHVVQSDGTDSWWQHNGFAIRP